MQTKAVEGGRFKGAVAIATQQWLSNHSKGGFVGDALRDRSS